MSKVKSLDVRFDPLSLISTAWWCQNQQKYKIKNIFGKLSDLHNDSKIKSVLYNQRRIEDTIQNDSIYACTYEMK